MDNKDVELKSKEINKILDGFYANAGYTYSKEELFAKPISKDLMRYDGKSKYYSEFNFPEGMDVGTIVDLITRAIVQSSAYQRTSQKTMNANKSAVVQSNQKTKETTEEVIQSMLKLYEHNHDRIAKKSKKSEKNIEQNEKNDIIRNAIEKLLEYQSLIKESMELDLPDTYLELEDSDEQLPKKIKKELDALIQTRQTHMKEVSVNAKIISKALGTNYYITEAMALGHDLGHGPFGHVGESILNSLAEFNNCAHIGHPAMGPRVLEREYTNQSAIDATKQFYSHPNKKTLRELDKLITYIIDGIVSHNGEGTVGKIVPKNKTVNEMKNETTRSFTQKGYDRKILPGTMEGAIVRYADILSYIRSDLIDGFRLVDENGNKIMNEFNDEYKAIIGTLLARKNGFNKMLMFEQKILTDLCILSNEIDEIEESKDSDPETLEKLNELKNKRDSIQSEYNRFCKFKVQYAENYINSIQPKSLVKTKVPEMMQNVFMADLIATSKDNDGITMSPLIRRTFFNLRELNGKYIIPYASRGFEEDLPYATHELVEMFKKSLIKSGIAHDMIPVKKRKKYGLAEEDQYSKKNDNDPSYRSFDIKMFHYYNNIPIKSRIDIFPEARRALKDIALHDMRIALGEERYTGKTREIYMEKKIKPIQERIKAMGDFVKTKEGRNQLLRELIQERDSNIEEVVASKMAIEYIAGMTDYTFITVLLNRNILKEEDFIKKYRRPAKKEKEIIYDSFKEKYYRNMIMPDSKEERE